MSLQPKCVRQKDEGCAKMRPAHDPERLSLGDATRLSDVHHSRGFTTTYNICTTVRLLMAPSRRRATGIVLIWGWEMQRRLGGEPGGSTGALFLCTMSDVCLRTTVDTS